MSTRTAARDGRLAAPDARTRRATSKQRRPARGAAWFRGATGGVAAVIVVVALSLGGVAWAWFGLGEGRATVSTAGLGTLTARVAPIRALAPGVQIPVGVAIDNRTGRPVTITGISVGHGSLTHGPAGACNPAVVSIRPAQAKVTAPPGRSSLAAVATMRADAPNSCQGATFALSLVVTGTL
jgi:hypothetical protein